MENPDFTFAGMQVLPPHGNWCDGITHIECYARYFNSPEKVEDFNRKQAPGFQVPALVHIFRLGVHSNHRSNELPLVDFICRHIP